jgi:hypothetical protein
MLIDGMSESTPCSSSRKHSSSVSLCVSMFSRLLSPLKPAHAHAQIGVRERVARERESSHAKERARESAHACERGESESKGESEGERESKYACSFVHVPCGKMCTHTHIRCV